MTKTDKSTKVGKLLAEKLKSLNISKVVFHRNGYLYHGRVAAVADAVRQENIEI